MTEIELNEQFVALLGNSEKTPAAPGRCRTGRQYRRRKRIEKANRRLFIIQLHNYALHLGYVDWNSGEKSLLHTGRYIRYSKNSNRQRRLKRVSSKKVRACPCLPRKGNGYRKVFDYWWTLY